MLTTGDDMFEMTSHPIKEAEGILTIQSLTIIFENSRTGEIPEDWKKASVVLIFHKGKKRESRKLPCCESDISDQGTKRKPVTIQRKIRTWQVTR